MRFNPIDIISSGCRSDVHRCIDHGDAYLLPASSSSSYSSSKRIVAIKLISNKELAYEEINKLLLVGHQNIVTIVDIVEDNGFVGIVMPCSQMDLRSFMGNVRYNTTVMLQIKLQTMAAVHHIHTRGILHLDIKPENICIDHVSHDKVRCILLDFGSSVVAEELMQRLRDSSAATNTIQTTRGYHSPELKSRGVLSSACDIYSAGVVFGELMEGQVQEDCGGESSDASSSIIKIPQFRQLSIDMQHSDFKRRPSSREVLVRLGDKQIAKPLLSLGVAGPIWTSPIANTFLSNNRTNTVANSFINDRLSTDLQKLVTLVRSSDVGHIRDAFWLLFETAVEEVDGRSVSQGGLSVLSILHYFESRIYLSKEHSFFYAKSLDILSRLPYFVLTDDMKLHLWKLSSSSHTCERPVLRCLANCWTPALAEWCTDARKSWGVRQEALADFAARFADDWDLPCAEAARVVMYVN